MDPGACEPKSQEGNSGGGLLCMVRNTMSGSWEGPLCLDHGGQHMAIPVGEMLLRALSSLRQREGQSSLPGGGSPRPVVLPPPGLVHLLIYSLLPYMDM